MEILWSIEFRSSNNLEHKKRGLQEILEQVKAEISELNTSIKADFEKTGIASAGGYVGDGVGTANLAGRTLSDLILNKDSELVSMPWVNHKSKKWEIEPFRWIVLIELAINF